MKKFLTVATVLVVLGFAVPTQASASEYVAFAPGWYSLQPDPGAVGPRPPVPPRPPSPGGGGGDHGLTPGDFRPQNIEIDFCG